MTFHRNDVHKSRFLLLHGALFSLMMLTGCPDEEGGNTKPDTNLDMTGTMDMDAPVDEKDLDTPEEMDMSADMPDVCVPETVCAQDACGVQPDGCGGELECDPCTCQGGIPSSPSCGTCGLGRARCEGEIIVCDLPELDDDALSNCLASTVYVDPSYTGFVSGTKEEPFKSLGEALNEFGDEPSVKLFVLREGTYTGSAFVLPQGTSILGGFDENWLYQPNKRSQLDLEHAAERRAYGILIEDEDEPVTLANLEVRLVAGATGGEDYVTPMEVRRSSSLTLRHVKTLSLDGVPGVAGEAGQPGQNGALGADAEARNTMMPATFLQAGLAASGPENCLGSQGGNGGRGGSATNSTVTPENGGAPLMGTRVGGDKGTEQRPEGQHGAKGYSAAGQGIAASDPPSGSITWLPLIGGGNQNGQLRYSHDSDGTAGQNGQDGGGGTGGGGGFRYTFTSGPYAGDTFSGGAGGAGGAGGCGGEGGKGGEGGGSSFGLVLVNSPQTMIHDSTFEAKRGGNGAPGGRGGSGGAGGAGGRGTFTPTTNSGGDGGDGGRGQDGAHGAPGSGGYSVGVMCSHRLDTSLDTIEAIGSTPGQGGRVVDSTSNAPQGQTSAFFGCE